MCVVDTHCHKISRFSSGGGQNIDSAEESLQVFFRTAPSFDALFRRARCDGKLPLPNID